MAGSENDDVLAEAIDQLRRPDAQQMLLFYDRQIHVRKTLLQAPLAALVGRSPSEADSPIDRITRRVVVNFLKASSNEPATYDRLVPDTPATGTERSFANGVAALLDESPGLRAQFAIFLGSAERTTRRRDIEGWPEAREDIEALRLDPALAQVVATGVQVFDTNPDLAEGFGQ